MDENICWEVKFRIFRRRVINHGYSMYFIPSQQYSPRMFADKVKENFDKIIARLKKKYRGDVLKIEIQFIPKTPIKIKTYYMGMVETSIGWIEKDRLFYI